MHVLLCASKMEMAGVLFVPAKIVSVSSAECMSTLPVCVKDGMVIGSVNQLVTCKIVRLYQYG